MADDSAIDPAAPALPRTRLSAYEAAVVTTMCFGLAIYGSVGFALASAGHAASAASPFTDRSLYLNGAFEAMLAAGTLFFLRRRGYAVGTLYPSPTWPGAVVGLVLFGVSMLVAQAVAIPFSSSGVDQPIQGMLDGAKLSLPAIVSMAVVNGAFEEIFLLGVLLRGWRALGASTALGLMSLVRLLCHVYQGPAGAVQVMVIGIVLGLFYLRTGRLWPVVFAHVLWDIVPFL